jgi:hypothetical protein
LDTEPGSDEESLAELEGDELEDNLWALREGDDDYQSPSLYGQLMTHKTSMDWKKAESVHALGYTKNSTRTQERRRKEAQDCEAFRENTKTS